MSVSKQTNSAWPEVALAAKESRRELVLTGDEIGIRLSKSDGALPHELYQLVGLNFLEVSRATLAVLAPDVAKLSHLTQLVLHTNLLAALPAEIAMLTKLKLLDVSSNQLAKLPNELCCLKELQTLNVSHNCLAELPDLSTLSALLNLDASFNDLPAFPPGLCSYSLERLLSVNLKANKITVIPAEIACLAALKTLNLEENNVVIVPQELAECAKLKDLSLKSNKLKDRRLEKLINDAHPKPLLEYIKKNCPKTVQPKAGTVKKATGKKETVRKEEGVKPKIVVVKANENFRVTATKTVGDVRPFFVACVVRGVDLKTNFKKFIQLQTKLHDGVCKERCAATIATHDFAKIVSPLVYSAKSATAVSIKPLGRPKEVSAVELVEQLNSEAEALRKEKKRNTYSGVHKYLYLLKDLQLYPCLVDASQSVISFPPICNSDLTKISTETTDLFVEVTSSESLPTCKRVMDTFLHETLLLLGKAPTRTKSGSESSEDESDSAKPDGGIVLTVEQVRVLADDDSLKVAYPSRTDLAGFADIDVCRGDWD